MNHIRRAAIGLLAATALMAGAVATAAPSASAATPKTARPSAIHAAYASCSWIDGIGFYCGKYSGSGTTSYGDTGARVYELQSLLHFWGVDPKGYDGIFGTNTRSAVRTFQSDLLLPVDGIVGPHTWFTLRNGYQD